jgi:NADH dehydrogenase
MGFGGIFTYLELHKRLHGSEKVHITIINDTDHFTFIPMIHEVATGMLLPSSITYSLRTIPQCCVHDFIEGVATHIDFDKKVVRVRKSNLTTGDDGTVPALSAVEVEYDYIVLATGSETNYFGVPGARECALPLKTLADAKHLKNHIIERFQEAKRLNDEDEQRNMLRFVIVGGGPSGVEIAGELSDILNKELRDAFPTLKGLASVLIIDRGERVLAQAKEWFGLLAEEILAKKNSIYIMHGTSVVEVTTKGVKTDDGFVEAGTVIWSAGVKASPVPFESVTTIDLEERTDRIKVNEYLQIPTHEDAFVIGDAAWIFDKEKGQPYPMRAQFAVRQGRKVAENIKNILLGDTLAPFDWKEKGMIISLGKGGALADVYGMQLTGFFAWLVYKMAYLMSIVGVRAKVRMATEWFMNLFLSRDITKL